MGEVVRLIDCALGYSPDSVHGLCDWLRNWADNLESPGSWVPTSLIVVIESDNGGLGVISQSLTIMDKARLVGLLQIAANRKADGGANLEDLEP